MKFCKTRNHPVEIFNMLSKMMEQRSKRFCKIEENSLISEATILEPRFKRQGFTDNHFFEKAEQNIIHASSHVNFSKEPMRPIRVLCLQRNVHQLYLYGKIMIIQQLIWLKITTRSQQVL